MDTKAYIQSGVIESYVLGLADAQEAAELQQLCSEHSDIKQAVAAFEASLEKTAIANAVPVPSSIKTNIFNTLKNEFVEEETQTASAPVIKMGWMRYAVAASVILLITSAGLNIYFYKKFNEANENYLAVLKDKTSLTADVQGVQAKMLDMYNNMQLMSDPLMVKVSMPGTKGKENNLTTVFWDSKTKDVYLLANKLAPAPTDKQYQLWALVDGKPVDAGLLADCNGLCHLKNIPKAQAFAITLEPKGGSASPHLDQLFVVGKVG